MAIVKRYIPLRDDDFFNWEGNFVNLVVVNQVAWGIPAPAVAALVARRAEFEPLYTTAQNKTTRNRTDIRLHREMRDTYEGELRVFVKKWCDTLATSAKSDLGLTIPDTEPSPSAPITDRPVTVLRNLGGGDISFGYKATRDQTRYSMHPDATNVEYRYAIVEPGDIPPDDFNNYPKQRSSSRAKFVVKLGSKNIGKRLYVVSRWVNKHRPIQEGPWATPSNEVIA